MKRQPATPKEMFWIGLIVTAVGLYFVSIGLGILPVPGGKRNLHAPLWVVFAAGLTFLLGGLALLLQRLHGADTTTGELPAGTPHWVRVAQYLIMVTIFASFALIGSWVAFGPGERAITMSMPFFSGPASEWVGRAAFGVGALVTWLCTIAVAVSGARKLRRNA